MARRSRHNKPYSVTSYEMSLHGITDPPGRDTIVKRWRPGLRRDTTEFHDALFSFGGNNKTARLSDSEFYSQYARELKYLGDRGNHYFRDGILAFGEALKHLFG